MYSSRFKSSRPKGDLLTPIRKTKKNSSKSDLLEKLEIFLVKPKKLNKDLSASPYNRKFIRYRPPTSASSQVIHESPLDVLYSWSSKSSENKFRKIRPCLMIKPDLCGSLHLFGLCDGDLKEPVSLISALFMDLIEKQPKVSVIPKHSLKTAYAETISELKSQSNVLVSHEFCCILLNKHKFYCFNVADCGVIVGRKTIKGWEASKLTGTTVYEHRLQTHEKIIVIGNSILLDSVTPETIIETASKYWAMKNPNIASWEITEKADTPLVPICLVIFLK
jgi:hypothetical protein